MPSFPGPIRCCDAARARFRMIDRDQFLASADDLVDPMHLLPNPGML